LWSTHGSADDSGWEQSRLPGAVSRDGRWVATRSDDGRVQICDVSERKVFPLVDAGPRGVLCFFDRDQTLATIERSSPASSPLLRHWNHAGDQVRGPMEIAEVPEGKITTPIAGSPEAGLGALAVGKGNVVVFDLRTGAVVHRLTWLRRETSWLQLSSDGRLLAAVSWPNRARLWDLASGQPVADWLASDGVVQRIAFSPDGGVLATAGDDNMITLWATTNGARLTQLRGHKAEVSALAFTPDGRTLASASTDLTLKLWHVPTWRELGTLRREKLFSFLVFAGDGPTLFAGEYRKSLHLFRAPQDAIPAAPGTSAEAARR
jgi:WD40 repeat protein